MDGWGLESWGLFFIPRLPPQPSPHHAAGDKSPPTPEVRPDIVALQGGAAIAPGCVDSRDN